MYEPRDNVAYAYREYPKWVYKGKDGKIVQDETEHETAKKAGWGKHGTKSVDVEKVVKPKAKPKTKPKTKDK